MFSSKDNAKRSPSESTLADSVRGGAGNAFTQPTSRLSSVGENNKNKIVSKLTRSSSGSSDSSRSEATPKATVNAPITRRTFDDDASQRSTERYGSGNEFNRQKGQSSKPTIASSQSKNLIGRTIAYGTKLDAGSSKSKSNPKSTFTFPSTSRGGQNKQSIFEKVDTHNGHTTFLGSGTFSQLEDCIANCLSHGQPRSNNAHHVEHLDFPFKRLTRASVLEDYSYDGVPSPHHHHTSHHDHHYSHRDHHYSHHNQYSPDHKKSAAELSLNEIHQVNDALSKYGVPVFSHHGHHHDHHYNQHHHQDPHHDQHHHQDHHYNQHHHQDPHHDQHHHHKPGHIGEILSACQLLMKDPTIASLRPGPTAVSHVWDAIQHHPTQPNFHGSPSSTVPRVASHLFGAPQQTPYNPVQGAASHMFGGGPPPPPPQNFYNPVQGAAAHLFGGGPPPPPPQNSYNPVQGAASHLFGGGPPPPPPQNSYNPAPGGISQFFGSGPPQSSHNSVQGVASRLFG